MPILISGSIAYDRIMDFPDKFKKHIMPDKIHILNVAFTISRLEERFGGTGANIAYNLSLLGVGSTLLGAIGSDGSNYLEYLKKQGINCSYISQIKKTHTSGAYMITDQDDNQIIAFYPGAMNYELANFRKFCSKPISIKPTLAIIAASSKRGMLFLAQQYKKLKIPYIFDPGQALSLFSKQELLLCIKGSKILIGNDYEIELIKKKTHLTQKQLLNLTKILITTLGAKGSELKTKNKVFKIPAYEIKNPQDPTGAGDAYRAGLLKGLSENQTLEKCAILGSVCASFAVEKYGTQEHKFAKKEFEKRYRMLLKIFVH